MKGEGLAAALRGVGGGVRVCAPAPEAVLVDWTGGVRGTAAAVVFPRSVAQVAAVVRWCDANRVAVTVQGGNTGMSGGAVPEEGGEGIVLNLRDLKAVREVDAVARTMTVEAGCVLDEVRETAAAHGLFFPLALGARGSCQIGGNLATNAGGLNVLRYGNARDLCLGVEAVLADGRVLHGLSPLRKNNSGYDLRHLLIGSEGTLAVITAAALRLLTPPRVVATAWAVVPSPRAGLELMNFLQGAGGAALVAFEMMPGVMFETMARVQPDLVLPYASPAPAWAVLLEAADGDGEAFLAALAAAMERGLAGEVLPAMSESQRAAFWRVREEAPLAMARHGKWLRADVALPIAALPAFIDEVRERLAAVCDGVYVVGFGHLGDGNLHVSARPLDADPQVYPELTARLKTAVYDCVARYGGTFSAEHGIGRIKTDVMRRYKDPVALELMRGMKAVWDKNGTLNGGVLLA